MRVNKSDGDSIHIEDSYYLIEEFHSKEEKWISLGIDNYYLPEYEFGEFSACGQCWQETGIYGCFNLEYAKEYCNKLNEALKNGLITDKRVEIYGITGFRILECERTFKSKPLIPYKY